MKIAIMFSGQGSQYANMGLDIFKKYPLKIKEASKLLNYNVLEVLKNNHNELDKTIYTQTLMTLYMIMMYDELKKDINVQGLLGFSLGEYSALYASGIYNFEAILKLVKYRAHLMEEATKTNPGKMAAVLNYDLEKLEELVKKYNNENNTLTIANYNSRQQFVISGNEETVEKAINELKLLGAKRIIPLNVSGGFHSKLMEEASLKLNTYLKTLKKSENKIPVYLNTTANKLELFKLEEELTKQIKSAVYFYQTIEKMIDDGFNTFIEVGPGKVLSNLVKRNYNVEVFNIETLEDLEKWRELHAKR